MIVPYKARLVVTPDNTASGSQGRLYLTLPEEMQFCIGTSYRTVGQFSKDAAVMFIVSRDGLTVTPRRQIWWKNGVRDHGIRRNWHTNVYFLEWNLFVVTLVKETDDMPPKLPLRQDTLF